MNMWVMICHQRNSGDSGGDIANVRIMKSWFTSVARNSIALTIIMLMVAGGSCP